MNNIGFWNVRGLNSVHKQNTVKWFLYNKDVGLFGLLETKINGRNVHNVTSTMLDGWCVTTNSHYRKGGRVWIMWRPNLFDVLVDQYDAQFIHTRVTSRISQQYFWLTLVYAFNDGTDRRELWSNLGVIAGRCQGPWAIVGDFNTVINPMERLGGNTKKSDMDEFIECLDECGMTDIAATGAYYTWNNKQEPSTRVYSRLDRFLINQEWLNGYPDMRSHFHPEGLFDHCPCTDPHNAGLITKESATANKVRELLEAKNSFLKQKAKLQWLEAGDSNTAYFHASIKKRNSLNKVTQIDDQYGKTCTDSQSIQNAFLNCYQTLLGTQKPIERVRNQVLVEGLYCNQAYSAILNAAVSDEELKSVFFSIPVDKSTGPYGYTSAFFKDSWDIVGGEVCAAIKDFFSTWHLLKQVNATNITLIPKCDRPSSVKQFRPIACCNMIYKVISKLLCNRLAQVLPDLISENQGAFIKGRSIIENVLICQDLVNMYNRKAVSPRCLFKIDLQKAYDTVEWDFVEQLFKGLQFPEAFIQRVMDKDWHTYSPPPDAAWAWKSICKIKEMMKNGYVANNWTPNAKGYTVSSVYEWLRHKQPNSIGLQ
ncbi:uncharacterized protein LOC141640848 [Silene latifolia]|uniref:uncharacterized protein LOC141640848 n=1 Tax=Silene latifolia TaxID=37657 RepID=UPI003D786F02